MTDHKNANKSKNFKNWQWMAPSVYGNCPKIVFVADVCLLQCHTGQGNRGQFAGVVLHPKVNLSTVAVHNGSYSAQLATWLWVADGSFAWRCWRQNDDY